MGLAKRLSAIAALIVAVLLTVQPTKATEQSGLVFITSTADPIALTFKPDGQGLLATMRPLLANRSFTDATVTLSLVDDATSVEHFANSPDDRVALTLIQPTVPAHQSLTVAAG